MFEKVKRKVILDTNLWSYIGDQGGVEDLRAAFDEHGFVVLVPPSLLLELLRNPDRVSRARQVSAIRLIRGRRMTSEAQLCAVEFVKLVRRRRRHWMRSVSDMATVAKFNRRWTKEWWQWAAEDLDAVHDLLLDNPGVAVEIEQYQRESRRKQLADKFVSDYNHLMYSTDDPAAAAFYLPGWDGSQVEAWRFDVAFRYWHVMTTAAGSLGYDGSVQTMRDWIGAYIDMRVATRHADDFASLFLKDAVPADVPRDWIRTAVAYTQTTMKVGHGNAADEQHSAYLRDSQLFLSADRRLIAALAEVRRQAPFEFAEPRLTDLQHGRVSAAAAIRRAFGE